MQFSPIVLMGNSAIINTNAVASTSQSTPLLVGGANNLSLGDAKPQQVRLINKGTSGADIWFSFTIPAAANIAIPTAGTTTIGTPQPVSWLAPGIEVSLTIPGFQLLTASGTLANPAVGIWLNTICSSATQPLYIQFGDGT